jgi:hypothetical protein
MKFQKEKRRNLLCFAKCFHHVNSEIISLYLTSPPVLFETQELENNTSWKLHFIEDDNSKGVY